MQRTQTNWTTPKLITFSPNLSPSLFLVQLPNTEIQVSPYPINYCLVDFSFCIFFIQNSSLPPLSLPLFTWDTKIAFLLVPLTSIRLSPIHPWLWSHLMLCCVNSSMVSRIKSELLSSAYKIFTGIFASLPLWTFIFLQLVPSTTLSAPQWLDGRT